MTLQTRAARAILAHLSSHGGALLVAAADAPERLLRRWPAAAVTRPHLEELRSPGRTTRFRREAVIRAAEILCVKGLLQRTVPESAVDDGAPRTYTLAPCGVADGRSA